MLEQEIAWVQLHMPRTKKIIAELPDLHGVRLACCVHLEIKMIPFFTGLMERGAQIFLTTCNATTVRDEVVEYLQTLGANADARFGMSEMEREVAITNALKWQPTHLFEMGGELSVVSHQQTAPDHKILASLEGTGSGIKRLKKIADLRYPLFNSDDLPVKEGLHNRHMVGLTTWQAFFERTRLSLHGKTVLVIGYGSVGRGVADSARAFGGSVAIAERDPARAIEAVYAGWRVLPLAEALPQSDVIVTATGAPNVLTTAHFALLRDGAFLLNVGHQADEIDLAALYSFSYEEVLPFIEAIQIGARTIYLFASGSMANLTAGKGDSLNAFDVTAAVLAAGIGYIVGTGLEANAGIHLLPQDVWESCLD